uniref:Charged multivesicular body protein 7 isoform X2 n=1 Tax=Nicotiana sylvestris TaxID=4096 RepID=A0A1U7V325_NICSY|nr:PREDICTED: charged multivesicular body protein 7 isoform X2 [Nicotiana sylvestris]
MGKNQQMESVKGEEESRLIEYLRKEVPDWDDEVKLIARYKAFSGQRSDWEPLYIFWRDLILKVARHLHIFIIRPSQVKIWFDRGGLVPLCLEQVLLEMYTAGELLQNVGVTDPASGWVSQILQKVVNLGGLLRPPTQEKLAEDYYIIPVLLKGVKVSLSARALSGTTSLDFDVLHLIGIVEKLEHQLNVIDQRWKRSRESALASLKLGNKQVALRCSREMKLASLSREKCTALLNRVEEVLAIISDAEASKEVSEAIRIGTQAIKENGIDYDEVELCLQELNECVESQKQIDEILGSNAADAEIDDEGIEDELKKLELNFAEVPTQTSTSHSAVDALVAGAQETTNALSDSLANLHISHHARKDLEAEHAAEPMGVVSNDVNREAALA